MISWSARRKIAYLGSLFLLFFLFFVIFLFFRIYTPPSCYDGKQNQGELGIDCGGPCPILCEAEALPATVHWSGVFRVKDDIYSAFAYVENPNQNAEANDVSYELKLYDANNILVYSNSGIFNLPAGRTIGVLESNLKLGSRIPTRADFSFNKKIVWQKTETQVLQVYSRDSRISTGPSGLRVNAEFVNRGNASVLNLIVVAILYGQGNNAIGVSKTMIRNFLPGSVREAVFVWPEGFSFTSSVRTEFLYWADSVDLII